MHWLMIQFVKKRLSRLCVENYLFVINEYQVTENRFFCWQNSVLINAIELELKLGAEFKSYMK